MRTSRAAAWCVLLRTAIERRLRRNLEDLVSFTDPRSRRGKLAYLRDDGHYGLIEPG